MTPAPTVEGRPGRVRALLIHAGILATFVPLLHYNLLVPQFAPSRRGTPPAPGAPPSCFERYRRVSRPLVELGRVAILGTKWRMFSPSWKKLFWIDWEARRADGTWVLVPTRNLSPRDRATRGVLDAWLFDFKRGRLQASLVHQETFRRGVARWLAREVERRRGWRPTAIRARYQEKSIPPPGTAPGWSPGEAPVGRVRVYEDLWTR